MEKNKELKLVFPDFNINESFANLIIIDANLYKRTNKLEMFIGSNYVLDIIDLAKFRNFLINKFKFTDVEFKINHYLVKNNNKSIKQITATGSGNDRLIVVVYTNS